MRTRASQRRVATPSTSCSCTPPLLINRQGAKDAKGDGLQKGVRGATLTLHQGPSGLSVPKAEPGNLGGPGTQRWRWVIMAVQVFLGSGLVLTLLPGRE